MRYLIQVLTFLFLISTVNAADQRDLTEIKELTDAGKYEEALARQLKFHEESKKSPAMGGVRLSFALMQWHELGRKYPKALESMKSLRDQNAASLMAGTAGFSEFHEVYAINRELNEVDSTHVLFLHLADKQPELARSCYPVVETDIVERGEFTLCKKFMGDPIVAYENARHMRELNLSLMRSNPALNTKQFQELFTDTFVEKIRLIITVLLHTSQGDVAKDIKQRALAYFNDERIAALSITVEPNVAPPALKSQF